LKIRLKDHFNKEDANGSIYRKNIGRAILNKNADSYLDIWEIDTSKTETKKHYGHLIDENKECEIETLVSEYLRNNISFVCFPVETEIDRLRFEEGIISALNKSTDFRPSKEWFGLNSPLSEIVNSGLWNRQGLDGTPLEKDELEEVKWLSRMVPYKNFNKIQTQKLPERKTIISADGTKKSADDIRRFIDEIFIKTKQEGAEYVDLVSGQIEKQLLMKNRLPQVCRIMYEKKKPKDEILHTTPSGKSSTIKIRYYL
jgi:hypothetical protein